MPALLTIRLTPPVLVYENLRAVLGMAVMTALCWLAAQFFLPDDWSYGAAVAGTALASTGMAFDFVTNRNQQSTFELVLDSRGMAMKKGRFVRTTMAVVPGAILSVDLRTGPALRHLGLARLRLNGIGQLPELPPLARADAEMLQRLAIERLLIDRRTAEEPVPCPS